MKRQGIMAAGAGLLWRRQRVVWWLFAANLAVGILAAAPVRNQLRILDSSMAASDALFHQMNLFRLVEAISRPEGLPNAFYGGSVLLMFAHWFFLLFVMGGVLETLSMDRALRFGEFLRSSAEYFWRMVRLLVVFAVLVAPLAIAQSFVGDLTEWIGSRSDIEQLGFVVTVAIATVVTLVGMAIRVWIDVAQVDAVAHDQPAVRRSVRRAWQLLRGNFWRVYGAVLAVQLVLFAITLLLLLVWIKLPHEAVGGTWFIGELIVLLWLGFRLWQKAVECAWYQRRALEEAALVVAGPPIRTEIESVEATS